MTRRESGFSLSEILVTTAFAPILAALVFSFAQSSFRAARIQQAVSEAQDTAHLALTVVTRDLRQAGYTPDGAPLAALARAEATTLAVSADLNGDGDCDDASESTAYREDAARNTLARASGAAAPQPLADHLVPGSLRFAYFDANGTELAAGGGGLVLDERRRVRRIDVSFAIAVPEAPPAQASASVELRNVR